jgi:hypothetical protein
VIEKQLSFIMSSKMKGNRAIAMLDAAKEGGYGVAGNHLTDPIGRY